MGNMFGGLKGQTRRLRSDYYSSNHGEAYPSETDRQVEHGQLIGISCFSLVVSFFGKISRFLYIHIGDHRGRRGIFLLAA